LLAFHGARNLSIPAEEFAVMAQQRLGVTTLTHPAARTKCKCICGYIMPNGTSDKHLSGCARLGNHVNPHNVMRDTLADFASCAQMQPEREPSLLGFKGSQGKALKADLRVVVEGQLRYYDAAGVSMYRKECAYEQIGPSAGPHHV
jgi:hypothetical protein